MKERVENSFILSTYNYANKDREVSLFTKSLGKIRAKVTSGRKTTSRLSPHLDPMTFSTVRIVEKHRFTVVDAFVKKRFEHLRSDADKFKKSYNIIYLLDSILPERVPDIELWYALHEYFEKMSPGTNRFLKLLGYDPTLAKCVKCNRGDVREFLIPDQSFLCKMCSTQIPSRITTSVAI